MTCARVVLEFMLRTSLPRSPQTTFEIPVGEVQPRKAGPLLGVLPVSRPAINLHLSCFGVCVCLLVFALR